MLIGGAKFFPRIERSEKEVIAELVDVCFDLAEVFGQHPDAFLHKTITELQFYSEQMVRMSKRRRRT